jgi:hypothetical protein
MDFGRTAIRFVLLTAVMFWAGQAVAADNAAAAYAGEQAAPHWHQVNALDAFHHPFDGLEMGLDLRLRESYAHNIFALDDQFGDTLGMNSNDMHWQRIRSRWSTMWTLSPDVTFNTRLVWEFWVFDNPERMPLNSMKPLSKQDTDFREMIFDTMNIQWKNAFDLPMT